MKTSEICTKDICAMCGVTRQTIHAWVRAGLPHIKKKMPGDNNGAVLYFDLERVHDWLLVNKPGRAKKIEIGLKRISNDMQVKIDKQEKQSGEPPKGKPPALEDEQKAEKETPPLMREDWNGVCLRAMRMELHTASAYMTAKRVEPRNYEAHKCMLREWAMAAEQVRRSLRDAADIEKSRGEVITRAEHDKELYESHQTARNALLNLPHDVAPLVAVERDERKCFKIIQKAVRFCMASIAEGEDK